MSDPHKSRSKTKAIYLHLGGEGVQLYHDVQPNKKLITTSSNYVEIIVIHEANHEYIWLRSVIPVHVCHFFEKRDINYEDNNVCTEPQLN